MSDTLLGFYNADCMEYLRNMQDNAYDLAIVDPPYGDAGGGGAVRKDLEEGLTDTARRIPRKNMRGGVRQRTHFTNGSRRRPDGTYSVPDWRNMGGEVRKKIIAWDVAPGEDYFRELFRVSRNQIIWGGNYFQLPPTRCFLIWRKTNVPMKFSMSMAEYAWTSFVDNAKVFDFSAVNQPGRFHPTQKPVELYTWILSAFAKPGDVILDTHVGSASSLIACERMGFKYCGFEIDKEYYKKAKERLEMEKNQIKWF